MKQIQWFGLPGRAALSFMAGQLLCLTQRAGG
jgi:hypothetical protein